MRQCTGRTQAGAAMHQQLGMEDVRAAAARIAGRAHRTPVLTCRGIDEMAGARVHFKCENLQKGGAFKFRGALNALRSLDRPSLERGVVTHSSGNHGAALALAARIAGTDAVVVMPENARRIKRVAVAGYGGKVILCPPSEAERERSAARVVEREGRTLVHPYEDPRVIAGQGTAALELIEQVPDADLFVAPVGGGGLLSGTAIAVSALRPEAAVIGAEPREADDTARSFAAGRRIPESSNRTIADGLRTSVGEIAFSIIRRRVSEIVTVPEEAIAAAMRLVWERMKIIIEPSSAVAVAALLARPDALRGRRVGVLLTGGNVDLDDLPWRPPAPPSR